MLLIECTISDILKQAQAVHFHLASWSCKLSMKYVSRDKTYSRGTNKIFIKAPCVAIVFKRSRKVQENHKSSTYVRFTCCQNHFNALDSLKAGASSSAQN